MLVFAGQDTIIHPPIPLGASLIAMIGKERRGVGAVGCTIRRLAAKVVGNKVMKEMASILSPRQLGYGDS